MIYKFERNDFSIVIDISYFFIIFHPINAIEVKINNH